MVTVKELINLIHAQHTETFVYKNILNTELKMLLRIAYKIQLPLLQIDISYMTMTHAKALRELFGATWKNDVKKK